MKTPQKTKSYPTQSLNQKAQLISTVIEKLYKQHGDKNITNRYIIEEIANKYFQNQKVTDHLLRTLRNQVISTLKSNKKCSSISTHKSLIENYSFLNTNTEVENISLNSEVYQKRELLPSISNNTIKSQKKSNNNEREKEATNSESDSDDSQSVGRKSVYYLDGNGQDQWASLVKYDSELYKREQELTRLREQQFKKKMKIQLDHQILQKQEKAAQRKKQDQSYDNLQSEIYQNFTKEEEQKKKQTAQRLELQKKMRAIQVKEVNKKKKNEKKKQDQFDRQMVEKIQEELQLQKQETEQRKERERQRLRLVREQSEMNQRKRKQDLKEERQEEIRQQSQYNSIQTELEKQRDSEKREREKKVKELIGYFGVSAIKEQKQRMSLQDSKMMNHIKKELQKKNKEQVTKKKKKQQDQKQLKQYFDLQIQEKKLRKQQQQNINRLQVQIWKQDNQKFKYHEQKRVEYLSMMKQRHNEILQMQIQEKSNKNSKKMNSLQLMYNKSLIRDLGKQNKNVKKVTVPI